MLQPTKTLPSSGPVLPSSGPVVPSSGPVVPYSGPVVPYSGPVVPSSGPVVPSSGPVVPSPMQSALLVPVTDSLYIRPDTLQDYQKLLLEAEQYEKRYKTVDPQRKKQLSARIKDILNKLRQDTFKALTNELLEFLNGQEQKVSTQSIRISNEEGKKFFSK
jgi:hypothetical protein